MSEDKCRDQNAGRSTSEYRLAPLVAARLVGAYLVVFAIVVLIGTVVLFALDGNPDLIVAVAIAGLVGVFVLGWWLRSRVVVVRLDSEGYRVRMLRGAGVREARWTEVEDVVATSPRGIPAVMLRLADGRTTTVPMDVVASDKEVFARDVQAHLDAARR